MSSINKFTCDECGWVSNLYVKIALWAIVDINRSAKKIFI